MKTAGTPRTRGRSPADPANRKRHILVTGYPGFIGKRLVDLLVRTEPNSRFYLLIQPAMADQAEATLKKLKQHNLQRVSILTGDVTAMHLGLSAAEYRQLNRQVTDIYHLAAISDLSVPDQRVRQVNVNGTRNMLELAEDARKLKRFNHVSTCFVSGTREGVISEEELEAGQGFRNPYERTKYEAERIVRQAMDRLPITVYRPSIVIGDAQTGEISRFIGPYLLGILLVSSPLSVPLPLPGTGGAPLNVVPVHYVVDAIAALSCHPAARGITFHLVDNQPLSVRQAYGLIGKHLGMPRNRLRVSKGLTKTLIKGVTGLIGRTPGLERVARAPRQAIEYVTTMACYTSRNTERLLADSGIQCPALDTYIDTLVDYLREVQESRKQVPDQFEDPLA